MFSIHCIHYTLFIQYYKKSNVFAFMQGTWYNVSTIINTKIIGKF